MGRPGVGLVNQTVLDASALLAFVFAEPGADVVADHLSEDALILAVNWSEVVQKIAYKGKDPDQLGEWVLALGSQVVPFDRAAAHTTAALYPDTAEFGLSLGDRACLSVAAQRQAVVLTADQAWARMSHLGVAVTLIH